jgi:hypothetical protein
MKIVNRQRIGSGANALRAASSRTEMSAVELLGHAEQFAFDDPAFQQARYDCQTHRGSTEHVTKIEDTNVMFLHLTNGRVLAAAVQDVQLPTMSTHRTNGTHYSNPNKKE